jgi:hypothetical protein
MPDVIGAFVRHEEAEGCGHQRADVLERARPAGGGDVRAMLFVGVYGFF